MKVNARRTVTLNSDMIYPIIISSGITERDEGVPELWTKGNPGSEGEQFTLLL